MQHELAPAEQQTTPATPKRAKERRVPKAISQAVELIVTGACTTQKAAAERVGITPEHLSRMLSRDYIRVFCERRARQTIAAGLLPASARLVELIHSKSDHVSADVSRYIAAVHGIAPANSPQVNVNIELKAGYVIDLSERNPRAEQIIEQNQIEALPNVGKDGNE